MQQLARSYASESPLAASVTHAGYKNRELTRVDEGIDAHIISLPFYQPVASDCFNTVCAVYHTDLNDSIDLLDGVLFRRDVISLTHFAICRAPMQRG